MKSLMLRTCAIILLFLAGIMVVRVMEGLFSSHRVSAALQQIAVNNGKVDADLKTRTARSDKQNGNNIENSKEPANANLGQTIKSVKNDAVVKHKAATRSVADVAAGVNVPIETGNYRRSCSIEQPVMAGPAIDVPLPFNSWSEHETLNVNLPTANAKWHIYRSQESIKKVADWYAQSLKQNGWVRYKNLSRQQDYLVYYVKPAEDGQLRYLGLSITDQQDYRRFGIILLPSESRDLLPSKSC